MRLINLLHVTTAVAAAVVVVASVYDAVGEFVLAATLTTVAVVVVAGLAIVADAGVAINVAFLAAVALLMQLRLPSLWLQQLSLLLLKAAIVAASVATSYLLGP